MMERLFLVNKVKTSFYHDLPRNIFLFEQININFSLCYLTMFGNMPSTKAIKVGKSVIGSTMVAFIVCDKLCITILCEMLFPARVFLTLACII